MRRHLLESHCLVVNAFVSLSCCYARGQRARCLAIPVRKQLLQVLHPAE